MTRRKLIIVAIAGALSLTACSGEISTSQVKTSVDITDIILTNLSGDCADYVDSYSASVSDLKTNQDFVANVDVSDDGSACYITSNDIPNYDFNDDSARWAEPIAEQDLSFTISRNPTIAENSTDLSMNFYNAVMLNGVVLDLLTNGCYAPDDAAADSNGNIAIGCGSSPEWALNALGTVGFGTDSHNGHTQPGGLYHYHGNPMALFDPEETELGSPVIGFAADGFPIYGPHYIDPASGELLIATSGYTLKEGDRPSTTGNPGGQYDGTYIQDYEFTNAGTLDKCNGMTINNQYGYYVTDSYPYVMACYQGTPDASFAKASPPDIIMGSLKYVALGIFSALLILLLFVIGRHRRKKEKFETEAETSNSNIPHVKWSS